MQTLLIVEGGQLGVLTDFVSKDSGCKGVFWLADIITEIFVSRAETRAYHYIMICVGYSCVVQIVTRFLQQKEKVL